MVRDGRPPGDTASHARERAAIVGLALATLPNEDEVRDGFRQHHHSDFPGLDEALETLTDLTASRQRMTHRAVTLRLLAKLASRRGMAPFGAKGRGVRTFLRSSVEHADHERDELCRRGHECSEHGPHHHHALEGVAAAGLHDEDPEVQQMLDGLAAAAERRAPSWRSFTPKAGALHLTDAEMALPRCSDDEGVMVGGHASTRVATWFSSPKPAVDFLRWTDVRTWPVDCSLFFQKMTPKAPIDPEATEYSVEFLEEVQISEEKCLRTPLIFTRRVYGTHLSTLYFTMPAGRSTSDLLVDTGSLVAREDPTSPPQQRTHLFAEKLLRFQDPALLTWPTLLCDLYWMELTILAALGCRHD